MSTVFSLGFGIRKFLLVRYGNRWFSAGFLGWKGFYGYCIGMRGGWGRIFDIRVFKRGIEL